MKKFFFSMLLFSLCCTVSFGQKRSGFGFGPKFGMNMSSMSFRDSEIGTTLRTKSLPGLTAGFFIDYIGKSGVGFSIDALYAGAGSKLNVNRNDYKDRLHYLNVPILLQWYPIGGFALKAGIQPGFLLSAQTSMSRNGNTISEDTKENFNTMDFMIPLGASYLFKFGLIVDFRYQIGLANIVKDNDDIKTKNNYYSLALGYRF